MSLAEHVLVKRQVAIAEGFLRSAADHHKITPTTLTVVDSSLFFAEAGNLFGLELIRLHAGMVLFIYDLFNRMMSIPTLLPDLEGDAERSNPPPRTLFNPCGPSDVLFSIPQSRARRIYAKYLSQCALQFIIGHEYAHIAAGHWTIGAAEGRPLLPEFLPAASTGVFSEDPITKQALEFDADSFGTLQSANSVLATAAAGPSSDEGEGWQFAFQTPGRQTYLLLFALYSLFCVFHDNEPAKPIELRSHPPAMLRYLLSKGTLFHVFQHGNNLTQVGAFAGVSPRALVDAERAYRTISSGPRGCSQFGAAKV